jgi:hypothetical protein
VDRDPGRYARALSRRSDDKRLLVWVALEPCSLPQRHPCARGEYTSGSKKVLLVHISRPEMIDLGEAVLPADLVETMAR